MSDKFIELVFIKNHLHRGLFNEDDRKLMKKMKECILQLDTPFREIAVNAINNCEEDIKNRNFVNATDEINLIHNFTFTNPKGWNADFFYRIELCSYIENNEDVQRLKKLFICLARLQEKLGITEDIKEPEVKDSPKLIVRYASSKYH